MARGPALAGSGFGAIASGVGGGRGNSFGFKGVIRASGPEGSRVVFLNPGDTSVNRNLFTTVKPLGALPLKTPGGFGENGKSGIGLPSFKEFTPGQIARLKTSAGTPEKPVRGSVRFEMRKRLPQIERRTPVNKGAELKINTEARRPGIFRGHIEELRSIIAASEVKSDIHIKPNPILEQVRKLAVRRKLLYQQAAGTENMTKPQAEQKEAIAKPVTSDKLKTAAIVSEKVITRRSIADYETRKQKREEKLQDRTKVVVDDRLQSQRIAALDAARRKILATEPDGVLTIRRVVEVSGVADFRAYRSSILEGTEHEDGGQVRMRKNASSDSRPVTESGLVEFAEQYVPVMTGDGRQATRKQFITVVTLPDELEPAVDPEIYFNPVIKTRIIEREETVAGLSVSDYEGAEQTVEDAGKKGEKNGPVKPILPMPDPRGSLRLDRGMYINNEGEELLSAA